MRASISAFALILALTMMNPATSYGYSNSFEFLLGSGSGDAKIGTVNADVAVGMFGLSYTHYFSELRSDAEPYGERVFLQHPAEISVELLSVGSEITYNGNKLEGSEGTLGISGTFYFPNNRTGLGFAIAGTGVTNKSIVGGVVEEEERSIGTSRLFVHHYIADSARIGLSLNSETAEYKNMMGFVTDKYEQGMLEINADILLENKFKLSAAVAAGEREYTYPMPAITNDVSAAGLMAGMYFSKTTGIFLSFQDMQEERTEGIPYKRTESQTALTVDHYFSDAGHFAVSLIGMSVEETSVGATSDVDATVVSFQMGFLF